MDWKRCLIYEQQAFGWAIWNVYVTITVQTTLELQNVFLNKQIMQKKIFGMRSSAIDWRL